MFISTTVKKQRGKYLWYTHDILTLCVIPVRKRPWGHLVLPFLFPLSVATGFHPSCWKLLSTFNASSPRPEEGNWLFLLFATNMSTFFCILHFFFFSFRVFGCNSMWIFCLRWQSLGCIHQY